MIVIIDYGLGNLGSVKNALDILGVDSLISKSACEIRKADGLILPGVGAAGEGMKNLKEILFYQHVKEFVVRGFKLNSNFNLHTGSARRKMS